ncbi:3-isopropylmalate dehydratase large subunit [Pseudoponticoccus marisrubri]|uniref:3-isopropylmalate dehydratase large subunit n=2 Tax=Pseudoponticoccus marisrubri TaxID=1685382 RepID=A0A0W7WEC1_9RHOB|nr:3-isopropylmalate dehydratase large subunit [Pseudoponticoccus marisrubri]
MAEKLLSRAANRPLVAGEVAVCKPDYAMGTDGSIPMALDYLGEMLEGHERGPFAPDRVVFALDHYDSTSGAGALLLQARARDYAQAHAITLFDVGDGIGHQLMMERGHAAPGRLLVGADSHATSYGAFNCFGTGIGSSDLAGILFCGALWLEVPSSIRIVLDGQFAPGVGAKDVALYLARTLDAGGATYKALEFTGPGLANLDMDDRIVLANMSVELGAKAGLFPHDAVLAQHLDEIGVDGVTAVTADPDAPYVHTLTVDIGRLRPQIALPHRVDNVIDLADAPRTRVDVVYLGTCTGGRLRDYAEALEILTAAGRIARDVQVIVTPASRSIREAMERTGMIEQFRGLGAQLESPGCGACCGTCGPIPAANQKIISSANRNFRGRMGNADAEIYLASPVSCARAAVEGAFGQEA